MTAEARGAAQATAARLVERSAAAFAASVAEHPGDDGFFGPGSVTWRVTGDLTSTVAGLRSLLLQALHPLAMAGVDQHSDWRGDPVGRYSSTSAYLATITYGDKNAAETAARRVRKIHETVRGTDPVTGRAYAAGDPGLLVWVHAALVDSSLAALELFGTALTESEADRYVAEMTAAAELVGVPRGMAPASTADLRRYLDQIRPELVVTPAATESVRYLRDFLGMDADTADIWLDLWDAATASLPDWARDMYGYESQPLTPRRRAEVRQVLGVLDALFLGEPGALEARQRIELRVRQARRQAQQAETT